MYIFKDISLEEVTTQADESGVVVPETEPMPDTAEFNGELIEQTHEINAAIESFLEALEDANDQETIVQIVKDSSEGEGLTPTEADLVEASIEKFARKFNLPYSRVLPSKESLSTTKASKLQVAKITLEEAEKQKKSIWQKIKDAFKWVWDKICSFFRWIFGKKSEDTKKQILLAEDIANRTEWIDYKDVDDAEIARKFSRNGKADGDTVIKYLEDATTIINGAKSIPKLIEDYAAQLPTTIDAMNGGAEGDAYTKILGLLTHCNIKEFKEARFLEDRQFIIDTNAGMSKVAVDFKPLNSNYPSKAKALNNDLLDKILPLLRKIDWTLDSYKPVSEKLADVPNIVNKAVDKVLSDRNLDTRDVTGYLRNLIGNLQKYAGGVTGHAGSNAIQAISAGVKYVKLSADITVKSRFLGNK